MNSFLQMIQGIPNRYLAILPMILPFILWFQLVIGNNNSLSNSSTTYGKNYYQYQLVGYLMMSIIGYIFTVQLVPHIQQYTLRKNICGKDLGKRGTNMADIPMYVIYI
jgi:hypothetical protein